MPLHKPAPSRTSAVWRAAHFRAIIRKHISPGGHQPSLLVVCCLIQCSAIKAISSSDERYEEYRASSDFIRAHIFPGGHMPCLGAMADAARGTGLSIQACHCFNKFPKPCLGAMAGAVRGAQGSASRHVAASTSCLICILGRVDNVSAATC